MTGKASDRLPMSIGDSPSLGSSMLDPYATEEDSVKPKFEAMSAEFQLWSDMALCISWQLTQSLAQGSACKRLAEMGSSHSWQIP